MMRMKRATPKDRDAILKLWGAEFGDGPEFIDPFIEWCGWDQIFLLWDEEGPCALTAAPVMQVALPGGGTAQVGYVYAHTTLKEHRSKGYGRALLRYVDFCLQNQGMDGVMLVPAQPSLFEYFRTEFYLPAFYLKEYTVKAEELPETSYRAQAAIPAEYATFRELFLLDTPHAVSPNGMLEQQKTLSRAAGADLYTVETPNGTACIAAGKNEDGSAVCLEFLAPAGEERAVLAALHAELGAVSYSVRAPKGADGESRPFGMMKWYDADKAMKWYGTQNGWFGLALD